MGSVGYRPGQCPLASHWPGSLSGLWEVEAIRPPHTVSGDIVVSWMESCVPRLPSPKSPQTVVDRGTSDV